MSEQLAFDMAEVGLDVPQGYKRTEVGVIPEDWDLLALGLVCNFENGDRSSNYPAANEFVEYGIPFINAGHVADGHVYQNKMDYIPQYVYERLGGGKVKSGDLLYCLRGSLGKFGIVSADFGLGAIASSLVIVRPKSSLSSTQYIAQYFKSELAQSMIKLWAGGAAQPNLGAKELSNFLILLPNQKEQTAIATALSNVDTLITELQTLIAKKQAIKTATMQQLLTGRTRLPQFALRDDGTPKGYKASEVGDIPEDWEVKEIGDLCSLKSGLGITSQDISNSAKYSCYGGNGLRGYTDTYTHDGEYALIGRQGALCGNIQYVSGRFFASEHALVVTAQRQVMVRWLAICLDRMNLNQYSESSAQPGLSAEKLRVLNLAAPSFDEQTAIASILSDMDSDISNLQQRLSKARQIKQGMMQQLLTGRIRLI